MERLFSSMRELHSLEDFKSISSSDGPNVSIGGYGSLLSEKSARWTFPDLQNFRVARIVGFRRVFNVASAIFSRAGIADLETKEIAAVSAEPSDGDSAIIAVFEIGISEVPAFIKREIGYRFMAVLPEDLDGTPYTQPVVICVSSTDEEYRKCVCKGSEQEFFNRFGQYGIRSVWRDDILPNPVYLRHCVLAAKKLGIDAHDNFLDHSYLGDKKTTIRHYLHCHPEIMETKPPPMLAVRYGG